MAGRLVGQLPPGLLPRVAGQLGLEAHRARRSPPSDHVILGLAREALAREGLQAAERHLAGIAARTMLRGWRARRAQARSGGRSLSATAAWPRPTTRAGEPTDTTLDGTRRHAAWCRPTGPTTRPPAVQGARRCQTTATAHRLPRRPVEDHEGRRPSRRAAAERPAGRPRPRAQRRRRRRSEKQRGSKTTAEAAAKKAAADAASKRAGKAASSGGHHRTGRAADPLADAGRRRVELRPPAGRRGRRGDRARHAARRMGTGHGRLPHRGRAHRSSSRPAARARCRCSWPSSSGSAWAPTIWPAWWSPTSISTTPGGVGDVARAFPEGHRLRPPEGGPPPGRPDPAGRLGGPGLRTPARLALRTARPDPDGADPRPRGRRGRSRSARTARSSRWTRPVTPSTTWRCTTP